MPENILNHLRKLADYFKRNAPWAVPVGLVGYALLITGLWLPFHWGKFGSLDHSLTYTSYEAIRLLIFKYGQFPMYLQNLNGGIDLWADPQSMTFGIFNIFPLLFGAVIGHKITVLAAYGVGMYFCYRLSQCIFPNTIISFLLALTYGSLGYFAHHIIEAGHSNFLYFHLLPLLGYSIYHQYRNGINWKNSLVIIIVYSQMILGGSLPVLMITLCCLVPIIFAATWPRYRFSLFQAGLGIGSILLMGVKIYPFFDVFGGSPRVFNDVAGINLQELFLALVDAKPYSASQSVTYHGWWEHGIGIGLIVPIMALYFLPRLANWKFLLFVIAILVWFGMGNSPNYANPWYLANTYLPVFENFRAPYRFLIGPILALLLIIPFALKKVDVNLNHVAILLLISLGYNTANVLSISKSFTTSQNTEDIEQSYNRNEMLSGSAIVAIEDQTQQYQHILIASDKHLVNTNYPLLDHIKHNTNTAIFDANIVANRQGKVQLIATHETTKTMLNFSPYWQCIGGKTKDDNGKLAIQSEIGSTLSLTYAPQYWSTGLIISTLGFVLLIVLVLLGYKIRATADAPSDLI